MQRPSLFSKTVVLILAVMLLGVGIAPAQERSAEPPEPPAWVTNFGKQLKSSLESDDSQIQAQALQHITYFATYYEREIDFSDAVPTLVDLYRKDDDANVRLFALVALYAIGDEGGMEKVRRAMYGQNWPPRLQLVTLAALTSYYGPETFAMDEEAAAMAENLMRHYTRPRIEIGPLQVVGQEGGQ